MVANLATQLRLLLVTDDRMLATGELVERCRAAVRGGVTAVQLRLKGASDLEVVAIARALVAELPVPLFVNDRLDLALAAGAAGVHLGIADLPPTLARRIAPPGFVIGASVGDELERQRGTAADYWGIGPLRATGTKPDAGTPLGFDGASRLLAQAAGRPSVLIGGVRPDDVPVAMAAGFAGVAVASGILGRPDVEAAARGYARDRRPEIGDRRSEISGQ